MCSDLYTRLGNGDTAQKICQNVHTRVGTLYINMCSDAHTGVGTPHMKICSDVHFGMGTPHIKCVEMFILGWGHRTWKMFTCSNWMGTPHIKIKQDRQVGVRMHNHATSWLHLARLDLPDFQQSWESKMKPSVAIWKTVWDLKLPSSDWLKIATHQSVACYFV